METSFDTFWNLFDNKKSRDKCERKWHLMSAKDQTECMDSLPSYLKETPDRTYRKHPATYLNNKCWQDTLYKEKEEETQLYKFRDERTISNYEPEKYDRSKGIAHMREKLRKNYENGSPIKDWGGVYTALLEDKCNMELPEEVERELTVSVVDDAERPRNRFEEPFTGSIVSGIRDAKLNWFLSSCRANKRDISLEI